MTPSPGFQPNPQEKNKRTGEKQPTAFKKRIIRLVAFFPYETRRMFPKNLIFVWLAAFLLMLFITNTGINDYYKEQEKREKIADIQKTAFDLTSNYLVYGARGLVYYFSPSANRIFATNTVIPPDMTAQVDSTSKVSIESSMKGKALVTNSFFGPLDVCLIFLLIMTILALYYGYDSFHTPEYLKFLASLSSLKRTIVTLLATRFLLFMAGFILLCAGMLILCLIRGVGFTPADSKGLWAIFGAGLVMLFVFFALGSILGTFKKNNTRVLGFTLTWILVAIIPLLLFVTLHYDRFQDALENLNVEINQYEEVRAFENKADADNIKYDPNDLDKARKRMKEYIDYTYQKIKAAEKKQIEKIQKSIDIVNRLAILHPAVFFWHTSNEASSCGYSNFMLYYEHIQNEQEAFTRFWIDRVYYHNPKELVPYKKPSEYIYLAQSRVPPYFWVGMMISILYGFTLFFIAYTRLKRTYRSPTDNAGAFAGLVIAMESAKKYSVRTLFREVSGEFLNLFTGQPHIREWQVTLEGESLINRAKKDFLYLPKPEHFPGDIRVIDLFLLALRLAMRDNYPGPQFPADVDKDTRGSLFQILDTHTQQLTLLDLAQWLHIPVVIFHDFERTYPDKNARNIGVVVDDLAKQGFTVIELISRDDSLISHDRLFYIHIKGGRYLLLLKKREPEQEP